MEKYITFSHNPQSSSTPRNFHHHNERNGGGRGSRCFPFLLPPFEKGNVFRVKVTGLLLWSEAEPSRRWEDRELPAKACHPPPSRTWPKDGSHLQMRPTLWT